MMTTKTLSLLATAALLAACGKQDLPAQDVRDALPKADAIQIGTPEAQAAGALVARDAASAAPGYGSEYAKVSYWTAVTVNVGVWWTLTLVETITHFQPKACTPDACTWGPWQGDGEQNVWQLVVTKAGDGYDYVLSAHPAAGGPEATLVAGRAYRGADRWHGNGTLTIDFDAHATLAHPAGWVQEDFGRIDVSYDNRTSLKVDATFLGARNKDQADPHFMNAAYAFDATGAGGNLEIGFQRLDGTMPTLKLHTRWGVAGAGRGDAEYVDGQNTLVRSQCWSGGPAYTLVFDDHSIDANYGVETDCAFAPAAYPTIAIPAP